MEPLAGVFPRRQVRPRRISVVAAAAVFAGALFLALLILPLLSLLIRTPPADLARRLTNPLIVQALRLSLVTTSASTAAVLVLGLPIVYVLALHEFPGKRALEVVIDLPMVLPPTVAGVGLLLAFGRAGLAGRVLSALGITVPFTTLAVILAQMFVAGPFLINTVRAGFEEVDAKYVRAAATLRASPAYTFFHVVLPLSYPALLAGAAMTWARALGEFGATITFAGNLPGRTQTLPLAVYIALESNLDVAVALSVILLLVSFGLLLALRSLPFAARR
jgi:molybdate transport system permease protein